VATVNTTPSQASWRPAAMEPTSPDHDPASPFGPPSSGGAPTLPIRPSKARSKRHSCRVRRKRQRLRSNGPIGSDPGFSLTPLLELCRAGLLPIESYRQEGPTLIIDSACGAPVVCPRRTWTPRFRCDCGSAAPSPMSTEPSK
jgi:hypothetical protein